MRLHRLEIQAFGPFRGREVVDVDALSASGLFLLHGPTGAGKTSVLDAICFALYGRVPGARAAVARLRSDHAEAGEVPQVICEFSMGPRRFEVTRSPAWERPKRRGGGTTTQQAHVLVRELVRGQWEPRTTRLDEAAHLLDDVLGMGPDQFTKLVLLPQGEFAAFLRADVQSRRQMLERLFGTDRFTAVQDWLREQRSAVRGQVDEVHAARAVLLARAEQAAAVARSGPATASPPDPAVIMQFPPAWPQQALAAGREAELGGCSLGTAPPTDAPAAAPTVDLVARVDELSIAVSRSLEDALARRTAAQSALAHAETAHQRATETARRVREHLALCARQEQSARRAPQREAIRLRLAEADRAQALAPLLPALHAAEQGHAEAAAAVQNARAGWLTVEPPAGAGDLGLGPDVKERVDDLREALARLAAVETAAQPLPALRQLAIDLEAGVASARSRLVAARSAVAEADRRAALRAAEAAEATAVAAGVASAQTALAAARELGTAVLQRDRLLEQAQSLRARLAAADQARNLAWERWLDLRERRLAGIAAELAGTLLDGERCRVCGSLEHPLPARAAVGAVRGEDEHAARGAHTQAVSAREAIGAQLAATEAELAAATRAGAGADAPTAAETVAAAAAALQTARDGVTQSELLRRAEAAERAAAATAREAVAERELQLESTLEDLTRTVERRDSLQLRVAEARGDDVDLASRRRRLEAACLAGETLSAAEQAFALAAAHLGEVAGVAAQAAVDGGFAALDDALAVSLDEAERERLTAWARDHDDEAAAVRDRLADQRRQAALATPTGEEPSAPTAADVEALDPSRLAAFEDDVQQARLQDQAATRRADLCDNAATELAALGAAARAHQRRSAPLLERHRTLDELTRCVEGTGADNARRMALSAFVLSARLEQVAQAATLRLAQMSGGRYALVHTEATERGRGRSGLALEVLDAWTGLRRETGSLSGGESFYASLALALGLADVVAAEAGGAAIDTLFVDEGFGSLDEETLEEVMDVLDTLRSGGRAVGIVSHVSDLRDRIPAQLEVIKTTGGSHLRAVG